MAGSPDVPDLFHNTVAFCRRLRLHGLPVTTSQVIEAVRALERLDLADGREVRLGLRSVLTAGPDELAVFDRVFATFWDAELRARSRSDLRPLTAPARDSADAHVRLRHLNPPGRSPDLSVVAFPDEARDEDTEPIETPGTSDREALARQDFSTFPDDRLDDLLRIAMALARRLESTMRRRWRSGRAGRLDLRRTIRASLARGELIELRLRRRRRRPLRLVVLCDVSGSMNLYSRVLVLFLFALQQAFARVETFAFSTRLTRITSHLKSHSYREALDRLTAVSDWSGGTRIGESLSTFTRHHGRLVDHQTLVIVLSDGWDTGDPAVLARELATIRRRARGVIWLNPLLGRPGYQPLTRGMAAALPHLDGFAPAHNIESLRSFARQVGQDAWSRRPVLQG
jgi:uncharacterized protein with von Willebrand factor type A (vWA) domain